MFTFEFHKGCNWTRLCWSEETGNEDNPADMLTKVVSTSKFNHCLNLVNVGPYPKVELQKYKNYIYSIWILVELNL